MNQDTAQTVTVDNFARAESHLYFSKTVSEVGLGKFAHNREPADVAHQTVIRMNRDTLYSFGVFDLGAGPVTITMPDAGDRYMALLPLSEDHYVNEVFHGAGKHTFSKADIGTRYVNLAVRTLVDPNDPADVAEVHKLQDAIVIDQPGGPGQHAYAVNNITAKKASDGSVTVQFGGDDAGNGANYLPTMPGWNYLVRLYQPRPEVLDGSWKFPDPKPLN